MGSLHVQTAEASDRKFHYLFAYFSSNKSGDENVQYAVSTDGLDYQPLNGGRPVILGDTTALSGGLRDPHLMRGNDGWFRLVATDMQMSQGKFSNRGIVMMRSRDLFIGSTTLYISLSGMQEWTRRRPMPSGRRRRSTTRP